MSRHAKLAVRIAAAFSSLVLSAYPVNAQESPTASRAEWDIAPFIGAAQRSPFGASWGVTPDRNLLVLGVHLRTSVLRAGPLALVYAPNVMPLMRLTHTPPGSTEAEPPALGFGVAPLGIGLRLSMDENVTLFGTGAAGATWFSREVPVEGARAFNVSIEWGGGLEIRTAYGPALHVGYKFLHLSNVYTATENPGVDAHLFYLGARWVVTGPR